MSHRSRFPSEVRTNAPFFVPTSTRTPLIPHSFPSLRPRLESDRSPTRQSSAGRTNKGGFRRLCFPGELESLRFLADGDVLRGSSADLNRLRLRLFLLRQRDEKDAVGQVCLDLLRIHVARKRKAPDELAVRTLDTVVVPLVRLRLECPLALEGQNAVLDSEGQVLVLEARDLDDEVQGLWRLDNVDWRSPRCRDFFVTAPRAKALVEEPAHLVLALLGFKERVIPSD